MEVEENKTQEQSSEKKDSTQAYSRPTGNYQPEYRQLQLRGTWRAEDRVKYDAENERLTQALKNSYRTSVSV